ncbi:hypothetical protein CLOP_g15751 [Closterium sp. NIES-67]|nr:hypothetical protein CLOP_g15751 [Closterium sp. NIES-67]
MDGYETARRIRAMEAECSAWRARASPTLEPVQPHSHTANAPHKASQPAERMQLQVSVSSPSPREETVGSGSPASARAGGSSRWLRRCCVLALTADVDGNVRRACAQAGMDGVLAKPIMPGDLLTALKKARYHGA